MWGCPNTVPLRQFCRGGSLAHENEEDDRGREGSPEGAAKRGSGGSGGDACPGAAVTTATGRQAVAVETVRRSHGQGEMGPRHQGVRHF